jgi:hypothetical protein
MDDLNKKIKEALSNVNSSLFRYECDQVSTERYPKAEKERCKSLEQYIESRFNYECSKIPELEDLILETEGRLFSCTDIEEPNIAKRRFKMATIEIIDPKTLLEEDQNLINEITDIIEKLGWKKICFNSVKRKIKIIRYD